MHLIARHRRPGRGTLRLILLAAAIFWIGVSLGALVARYSGAAATRPTTQPTPPLGPGAQIGPTPTPATTPTAAAATTAPAGSAQPTLQPGDRIELQMQDLAGPGTQAGQVLTVDPKGNISLPLVGTIRAQHLTPAQLEGAIAESYRARNLIQNSKVRITRATGATTAPSAR